jgi:iron complex transport system ATP-binding protein
LSSVVLKNAIVNLGGHHRIGELNAEIRAGEIVAIVGPNGAGKTTMLRALAGLIPLENGQRTVSGIDQKKLPHSCAFAPAHLLSDLPFSVEDVVRTGLYQPDHTATFANQGQQVDSMLATFSLDNMRTRKISTLSSGELQRVNLARTFIQDRPFLMLDEPFGPLDISYYRIVINAMRLQAKNGRGMALIVHDLNLALQISTQVLLLKAGKTLCQGPGREVLTPQTVSDAFGISSKPFTLSGGQTQLAFEWTSESETGYNST